MTPCQTLFRNIFLLNLRLSEHVARASTLSNGAILIAYFDNPYLIPIKWMVLPNPYKELPL